MVTCQGWLVYKTSCDLNYSRDSALVIFLTGSKGTFQIRRAWFVSSGFLSKQCAEFDLAIHRCGEAGAAVHRWAPINRHDRCFMTAERQDTFQTRVRLIQLDKKREGMSLDP